MVLLIMTSKFELLLLTVDLSSLNSTMQAESSAEITRLRPIECNKGVRRVI